MTNLQEIAQNKSIEELIELGIQFQKKTVESLLIFSRIVYCLKEACDKDPEQDFQELALERWGLSNSNASQYAKIGANAEVLIEYSQNLPPSARGLYELTQLPRSKLTEFVEHGEITPASTVNDLKAIKETIKEEKKKKKDKNKASKNNSDDDDENPFKVEVTDDEGNIVDAELENTETKTKRKKLTVKEALELFEIDLTVAFVDAKNKGKDEELLKEAFYLLTGEKI